MYSKSAKRPGFERTVHHQRCSYAFTHELSRAVGVFRRSKVVQQPLGSRKRTQAQGYESDLQGKIVSLHIARKVYAFGSDCQRSAFQDLRYDVQNSANKKETLHLLQGVTGFIAPGEMTALVRPVSALQPEKVQGRSPA